MGLSSRLSSQVLKKDLDLFVYVMSVERALDSTAVNKNVVSVRGSFLLWYDAVVGVVGSQFFLKECFSFICNGLLGLTDLKMKAARSFETQCYD
jgi:hypothetical protein